MKDFHLVIDFRARDDAQANRITEVIGNALHSAGIETMDAHLEVASPPTPVERLFARTEPGDGRVVPTAAASTEEESRGG